MVTYNKNRRAAAVFLLVAKQIKQADAGESELSHILKYSHESARSNDLGLLVAAARDGRPSIKLGENVG